MDEVFMEVPAVRQVAGLFKTIGTVLNGVAKTLQMLIMVLRTTAFTNLVGGAVIAQYLEQIKPQIEKAAAHCIELNGDLSASVAAYERGDQQGATRFF